MNNLQNLTKAVQYKQRFKSLLQQKTITRHELNAYNRAVEHYKTVYPDWRESINHQ